MRSILFLFHLRAEKSLFRIARYFEKETKDVSEAIKSYSLLAAQYPTTVAGKLAAKKIKEPPKEVAPTDTTKPALPPDQSESLSDSTNFEEQGTDSLELIEKRSVRDSLFTFPIEKEQIQFEPPDSTDGKIE